MTRPGTLVPGTHSMVDVSNARTASFLIDAAGGRTVLDRVLEAPADVVHGTFEALDALALAFTESVDEHEIAKKALSLQLRRKLVLLDPDNGSSLQLDDGLSIRKVRVDGFASEQGWVPEFSAFTLAARIEGAPHATPVGLSTIAADTLVDYRAMEVVASEWMREGRERLAREGAWELLPRLGSEGDAWETHWCEGRGSLALIARDGVLALRPSKELVIGVNARSPRTRPFADWLEPLDDGEWQRFYEGTAPIADPLVALRARALESPPTFAKYKSFADALSKAERHAEAALWLGLGYVRAHKVASVARARLEAARALDPDLEGLSAAFAELDRLGR